MRIRTFLTSLICFSILSFSASALAVRPAIGKALNAAKNDTLAKDFKGAMAEIKRAEAVPNQTPDEATAIAGMKIWVAGKSSAPQP